jgi:hypothetical protein
MQIKKSLINQGGFALTLELLAISLFLLITITTLGGITSATGQLKRLSEKKYREKLYNPEVNEANTNCQTIPTPLNEYLTICTFENNIIKATLSHDPN